MKRILINTTIILLIVMAIYCGKAFIYKSNAKKTSINESYEIASAETLQNNLKVVINEQSNGEKGTFYLGMIKQEVLHILKTMGIDYDCVYITDDRDDWNYGNEVMMMSNNLECSLTFDNKDKLYAIGAGEIPTILGLKSRDSLEIMEKLYGKNYTSYNDDKDYIYEYKISDHYFQAFIRIKKI